jgi:hypothetical protein
VHRGAPYSFEDIHAALFAGRGSAPRTTQELKDGIREHMRKKRVRRELGSQVREMTTDNIDQIPGAAELSAWFGGFPSFHDANVAELEIRADRKGATGHLKINAFRMTDRVDSKGYFILEKHCLITLNLTDILAVNLSDFMQGAIISSLDINRSDDAFQIAIESSYGFFGSVRVRQVSIQFEAQHV